MKGFVLSLAEGPMPAADNQELDAWGPPECGETQDMEVTMPYDDGDADAPVLAREVDETGTDGSSIDMGVSSPMTQKPTSLPPTNGRRKKARFGVRKGHCNCCEIEPGNAVANAILLLTTQSMYNSIIVRAFVDDPSIARDELCERITSNICDLSYNVKNLAKDILGEPPRNFFCFRIDEGEFKGGLKVRITRGDRCAGRQDENCPPRGVGPERLTMKQTSCGDAK